MNVVGGLWLDEPASDLPIALALTSALRDRPIPQGMLAIGEVGLTGELRSVDQLGQRLSEVHRLGFRRCVIPKRHRQKLGTFENLQLIEVSNIGEAIRAVLGK